MQVPRRIGRLGVIATLRGDSRENTFSATAGLGKMVDQGKNVWSLILQSQQGVH